MIPDPVQTIAITDEEVAFYHEYGYLPIPGFLRLDRVAELREEVFAVLEQGQGLDRAALAAANSTADKLRQESRYLAGSGLDAMINSPRTLAVAARLIGGEALRYLPFTAVKAAGGGEFHLHQDNNYTRHEPAMGSINIWVALVDMTPENGCLRLAPGSHRQGPVAARNAGDGDGHRAVEEAPALTVPLRMRAGDAVAFSRLTIHGSGPHRGSEPRVAYALQYHRRDVRYLDPASEQWKDLASDPRWNTEPLPSLAAAT